MVNPNITDAMKPSKSANSANTNNTTNMGSNALPDTVGQLVEHAEQNTHEIKGILSHLVFYYLSLCFALLVSL